MVNKDLCQGADGSMVNNVVKIYIFVSEKYRCQGVDGSTVNISATVQKW